MQIERFALTEQSALARLCEHRLASLDYVASGSGGRAVKDRILDSPPKKEITKTDTLAGSILVILGGPSRTRT